jgi:DNA-binding GntR family transcriptional regulator
MAATQAKRKHIDAMEKALASMKLDADRGVLPLEGDRAFHTAIVESCGNVVLIETIQRFWDSRRGPLFERLGGHLKPSTPGVRRSPSTRRFLMRCATATPMPRAWPCMRTWTSRTSASA